MFSRQELVEMRDHAQRNAEKVRLQATADINHAQGQVLAYDALIQEWDRRASGPVLAQAASEETPRDTHMSRLARAIAEGYRSVEREEAPIVDARDSEPEELPAEEIELEAEIEAGEFVAPPASKPERKRYSGG
jgi:hypothetical protein